MKVEWDQVPVRRLVDHYIGGGWGKEEIDGAHTDGAFVIRGTDIPSAQFGGVSDVPYRYHKPSNLRSRRLQPNDIVFEVSGGSKDQPVGRALLISESLLSSLSDAAMCASFCKLMRLDPQRAFPRFFLYYLSMIYDDRRIMEYQTQSTGISNFKFEEFLDGHRIPLPPLEIQECVAAVLAAYDELIENNLQRIEILEEMAQAVYREWFVNFRFPGHECVALVGSPVGPIPQGWEVVTMSDFTTTQYGYTASTEDQPIGPKFLRGMDFNKRSWIDWSEVPYCPISDTDFAKYKVETGDVLVIRMADPGKVGIVEKNVEAVFASYVVRVTPDQRQALPYWLFYFMSAPAYQGYISGAGTGTTRKSASAGVLTGAKLALPPVKVQGEFADAVTPLRRLLNNLIDQNANLRTTRDLLLPKLVSGEIDVSDLDIDTEWLVS
jgi:type I restriction enzyme S subunit